LLATRSITENDIGGQAVEPRDVSGPKLATAGEKALCGLCPNGLSGIQFSFLALLLALLLSGLLTFLFGVFLALLFGYCYLLSRTIVIE